MGDVVNTALSRRATRLLTTSALAVALVAVVPGSGSASTPGDPELVSVTATGTGGNGQSHQASISGDGRWVAFMSLSTNLVPGTSGQLGQIYVRDRATGVTSLVSASSSGLPANGYNTNARISASGRYVAFESYASNLVPNDTNQTRDVIVRDLVAGTTTRASIANDGSEANDDSYPFGISADGRKVAFLSWATNLVADDTNGAVDIFIRDLDAGTTIRASVATDGTQGNSNSHGGEFSADGRFLVFTSVASNLVPGDTNSVNDVFVRDLETGVVERVDPAPGGGQANGESLIYASLSHDGRFVLFTSRASNLVPGDTNGNFDVFRHDRVTGATVRVSVGAAGEQVADVSTPQAHMTGDGARVVFTRNRGLTGVTDVHVRDLEDPGARRLSETPTGSDANGASTQPVISADGTVVAFDTRATNLVTADTSETTDVLVRVFDAPVTSPHDLVWASSGELWVGRPGGPAPTRVYAGTPIPASQPSWSPDRSKIAFTGYGGVYVLELGSGSVSYYGAGSANGGAVAWSPDGTRLAFTSDRDGDEEIWTTRLAGGSPVQVTRNTTPDRSPAWSPDGRRIAYDADGDLALIDRDGTDGSRLTALAGEEGQPSWSPDGARVAFRANGADGQAEVFTIGVDGTDIQRVTDEPSAVQEPSWSPDGAAIAFSSARTGEDQVWAVRPDGTGLTSLPHPGHAARAPDWGQLPIAASGPAAPSGVVATPGNASASVSFVPPASESDAPVTSYRVTASPGGATRTGSGTTIAFPGLTNGTAYTFTVAATNTDGTSAESGPSAPITPSATAYHAISDVTVTEANTTATLATFTVTRSGNTAVASSVRYATEDGTATTPADYAAKTATTLSFAAGQVAKTFTVSVAGDVAVEPDETFGVRLSAPVGGTLLDAVGVGTIVNDDSAAAPTLAVDDASIIEGASGSRSLVFTVRRSGSAATAVSAKYATANGTAVAPSDFTAVPATTVSLAVGQMTKTVSVAVKGDLLAEGDEYFTVSLSAPVGATVTDGSARGTILNDDSSAPPTFAVGDLSFNEGDASKNVSFAITRSGNLAAAASVKYRTLDGTATAPGDYTAKALSTASFAAGVAKVVVTVAVKGELVVEADETFSLVLSAPVGAGLADGTGVATIVNDDSNAPPTFAVDDISFAEGSATSKTVTFTISRSGSLTAAASVKYRTVDGTAVAPGDYVAKALTTVNFPTGARKVAVNVTVKGGTVPEPDEYFSLVLSAAVGASVADGTGTATIVNDD